MREVALRLQSLPDGCWQVLLRGYQEKVKAVGDDDLAGLDQVPPTWDEVLYRMAPGADWRLDERALRAIGQRLFERLITGSVSQVLRSDADEARAAGTALRLIVQVFNAEPDSLLHRLPFELLYDHTFWFRRAGVVGVRRPDATDEGEVIFSATPKAVVAWAASAAYAEPTATELREHGERIKSMLEQARFSVRVEGNCTPARLRQAIEGGCELLYVACHGSENYDSHGQLNLNGGTVTGTALGEWLYNAGMSGQRVQVAVLCACGSASTCAGSSGMAQYVTSGRNAVAAIGYRAPVWAADALPFMETLIRRLADGESFEQAACHARRSMPPNTPDWTLPLLFARERSPHAQPAGTPPQQQAMRSLLPQQPRDYFVARQEELDELRSALAKPGVQVLAAGEGGIGKTEIARVLAHQAVRSGQLVMWLQNADLDPVRALTTLLKQALPGYQVQPDATPETLRAAMCHALGSEHGLLVLDDLASGSCVELLRPSGSWSVLITSRNASLLPSVTAHTVPPLAPASGATLLARLVYEQDELPEDQATVAQPLLGLLGGVPLLLETVAAQLRDGREYPELLKDLQGGLGDVHAKATALFRQSLARLTEEDRFAWYVVAALPTAGARARNLAAAQDEHEAQADRRLRRLRDRSMVRWPAGSRRATLHPLARQIACELAHQAGVWERVLQASAEAILDETSWCVATLGSDGAEAFRRWFELRQFVDTISLTAWPGKSPGSDKIASALLDANFFRSLELPLSERDSILLEISSRAVRPITKGRYYKSLGDSYRFRNDLANAERSYTEAMQFFEKEKYNLGIAHIHRSRGDILRFQSKINESEEEYSRALKMYEKENDRLGLANIYKAIGDIRSIQEEQDSANILYTKALNIFAELKYDLGLANVHKARGSLRSKLSDFDGAEQDLTRALELYTAVKSNLGIAHTYAARASLRALRGHHNEADRDYSSAISIFSLLGPSTSLARTYKTRGNLRRLSHSPEHAIKDYELALAIFDSTCNTLESAFIHQDIGHLYHIDKKYKESEKSYSFSINMFSDADDRHGLATTHLLRGNVYIDLCEPIRAKRDFDLAIELYSFLQSKLGMANAHRAKGDLYRKERETQHAEYNYSISMNLFIELKDDYGLANIHHSYGDLYLDQLDLDNAGESYRHALFFYEIAQNKLGTANTLVELATVAAMRNDHAQALDFITRAEPLVESSHNAYGRERLAELRRWLDETS